MAALKIRERFAEVGLMVCPTEQALEEMNISRRRLTQLVDNTNKRDMTVSELEALSTWMAKIADIDFENIIGENTSNHELIERLNMSK
jgi:hypothetical protein